MSRSPDNSPWSWSSRSGRRLRAFGLLLLLGAYAVFTWRHASIAPAGADASGYFNLGRMLLEGKLREVPRVIEGVPMSEVPSFTYCPLGFVPDVKHAQLIPTYPPGLPLLFAGASLVGGWESGPHALMALLSALGLVLTYRLARDAGATRALAGLAAGALAISPLYLAYSTQAMSDLPALCACGAALWWAAKTGPRSAFGCGVAVGFAVLLRPTNALLLLPVAVALGRPSRRWLWVAAGGLPAALVLGWLNAATYGSPFVTGYGKVGEYFSAEWVRASATNYARWMPVVLTPLFLAALAAPWHRRAPRRALWAHVLWVVALAGFYLFYYFTHREWWYLRFLLPLFPSLLVLAALGAEVVTDWIRQPLVRRALWAAAALVLYVNAKARWFELGIRETGEFGGKFTAMQQFVRESVPANAVVLSLEGSGVLFFHTPLCIVRWDSIDDGWPRVRDGAVRAGRPVYAVLFSFEDEKRFRECTPGDWRKVGSRDLATLWQLAPPATAP